MMNRIVKAVLLASSAIAPAAVVPIGGAAFAQTATRNYSIPAQDLGNALRQFASQSGRDVVFDPGITAGKTSKAVQGAMSAEAALRQMTEGSGLSFKTTSSGYAVTLGNALAGADSASSMGDGAASEGQEGIAEILVVGSRSQNVDIRRSEDDPQPYVVFNSHEIENSQAATAEEFLRTRLPMNTQASASNQANNLQSSNISQIDLRGLGLAQTLILIDGRRAPRVNNNGDEFTQADINGLPVSSIERIEILPATAGGIYGGGAVGGVINIVRKRDYSGATIRLGFDGAFNGGAEAIRADLSGGFSPNKGQTSITFSASHQSANPLYVSDNSLWRRSRELFLANSTSNTSIIIGALPNVRSRNGSLLTLRPAFGGASLDSNVTTVPYGFTNTDPTAIGQALSDNAGLQNIELSENVQGRRGTLRTASDISSLNLNVRHSFSPTIEAFIDGTFANNHAEGQSLGLALATVSLTAAHAGNPFLQPITLTLPLTNFPDTKWTARSRNWTMATGAIVRISERWKGLVEYDWSRSEFRSSATSRVIDGDALQAAIRSGTLNVFRDLNVSPIDYTPFLLSSPEVSRSGPYVTTERRLTTRVSGPVMTLPGGAATFTGLLEARKEVASKNRSLSFVGGSPFEVLYPRRSQKILSGYAELVAPVVSRSNGVPGISELELQLSARFDRYVTRAANSVGGFVPVDPNFDFIRSKQQTVNFTFAGRWSPLPALNFRGSYSTGFLAPTINQISPFSEELFSPSDLLDPLREGEDPTVNGTVQLLTGGNPNLNPEKSKSTSVGVVLKLLPAMRVSIDYTVINKHGEIQSPRAQFILDNEASLSGRIVRDGPGGRVTQIDATYLNVARTKVRALDIQAEYDVRTSNFGDIKLYAVATKQSRFFRRFFPDEPGFDTVGQFDGPLEWRANGGLDWHSGSLGFGWNMQFYDSYSLRSGDPAGLNTSETRVANQGGVEKIRAQYYHDVRFRYRIGSTFGAMLSGTEIALGIQNLFGSKPPAIANRNVSFSPYGDPRLRRFTLSITKRLGS